MQANPPILRFEGICKHFAGVTALNNVGFEIREGEIGKSELQLAVVVAAHDAGFRARAPQAIARMKEMFLATDPAGYIASSEAVRDMDFTASNPRISAPVLVIVGKQDPATPPAAGEAIVKQIKGAKLAALDAAHISNIEQPQLYTETVLNFLRA